MENENLSTAHALQFTGKSSEFFKIWIVNIALSILTLGIYSAWAKVRTRRYFYSNTLLMNTPFDYLAEPMKILKGRLIAFSMLIIYSISGNISPMAQGVVFILFLPLLPLIIIKALNFNAFNTSYRNLRFHFKGHYLAALGIFIGLPILAILTLGLAYPYFAYQRKKFIVTHMAYGTCHFEFEATVKQFYGIYIKAFAIIVIGCVIVITTISIAHSLDSAINMKILVKEHPQLFVFAIMSAYFFTILLLFTYLYTVVTNLVVNQTKLGKNHFSSHLQVGQMIGISLTNLLVIICSFGLMIPWAMVRVARYRVSTITVHTQGNPADFIADVTQQAQAIGEEIGDMFDIEIGL